jgi:hypothetical protein
MEIGYVVMDWRSSCRYRANLRLVENTLVRRFQIKARAVRRVRRAIQGPRGISARGRGSLMVDERADRAPVVSGTR